jgi:hypothetical protein
MGNSKELSKIQIDANDIVAWSAKIPTVHVNREKYLRAQFDKHCDDELLQKVIELGPVKAGIPARTINMIAKSAITHETALVTLISTAAGIPGGVFMWGTIPGDIAQFHGAMIRMSQKLAYIHGWPELFEDNGDNIDDETRGVLLLFLGVMYGVAGAAGGLEKIGAHFAAVAVKKLPEKALTKGLVYPIVKKVANAMSIKMTKSIFANGVGKAIPVLGGILSGAITLSSFHPMANRLNRHLIKRNATKRRAASRANKTKVIAK